MVPKLALNPGGETRGKAEAGHYASTGSGFNQQRNLLRRLVMGVMGVPEDEVSAPLARILKFIERPPWGSVTSAIQGTQHHMALSSVQTWKWLLGLEEGEGGQSAHSMDRGGASSQVSQVVEVWAFSNTPFLLQQRAQCQKNITANGLLRCNQLRVPGVPGSHPRAIEWLETMLEKNNRSAKNIKQNKIQKWQFLKEQGNFRHRRLHRYSITPSFFCSGSLWNQNGQSTISVNYNSNKIGAVMTLSSTSEEGFLFPLVLGTQCGHSLCYPVKQIKWKQAKALDMKLTRKHLSFCHGLSTSILTHSHMVSPAVSLPLELLEGRPVMTYSFSLKTPGGSQGNTNTAGSFLHPIFWEDQYSASVRNDTRRGKRAYLLFCQCGLMRWKKGKPPLEKHFRKPLFQEESLSLFHLLFCFCFCSHPHGYCWFCFCFCIWRRKTTSWRKGLRSRIDEKHAESMEQRCWLWQPGIQ